jgi:hypothetical protein
MRCREREFQSRRPGPENAVPPWAETENAHGEDRKPAKRGLFFKIFTISLSARMGGGGASSLRTSLSLFWDVNSEKIGENRKVALVRDLQRPCFSGFPGCCP